MSNPSDDYWKNEGTRGGNRPDNFTSDSGWKSYNDGKEQRDLNRAVEDSNKKLYDPNNNGSKI